MEEQNRQKSLKEFADIIIWIFLIVALIMGAYAAYQLKTEGGECLLDPLVYGVQHTTDGKGVPITCMCSDSEGKGSLYVTSEGKEVIDHFNPDAGSEIEINLSTFD